MPVSLAIKNSIAVLTIDNPKKLNALSSGLMEEISEKLSEIEQSARVLIISGCQKAFAAGVDVNEIYALSFDEAVRTNFINERWEIVKNIKIPVIAAVRGYALGGGFELALMCDMIIASENAVFGFPEIKLGLMPGLGGTQMLTKIIGTKIASELIMTGDFISAEKALSFGIVNKVVKDTELMKEANALAEKIATMSPVALKMIKEALLLSQNIGVSAGTKIERQMFRSLFSSEDKKKKTAEFLKK